MRRGDGTQCLDNTIAVQMRCIESNHGEDSPEVERRASVSPSPSVSVITIPCPAICREYMWRRQESAAADPVTSPESGHRSSYPTISMAATPPQASEPASLPVSLPKARRWIDRCVLEAIRQASSSKPSGYRHMHLCATR